MKILITGSDGFVGKRFCEFYKEHEITKIDIKNGNDCRDFFKISNEKFQISNQAQISNFKISKI